MCLDHLEIEGNHPIEQSLIGLQLLTMRVIMMEDVPDGRGRFCHVPCLPCLFLLLPVLPVRKRVSCLHTHEEGTRYVR